VFQLSSDVGTGKVTGIPSRSLTLFYSKVPNEFPLLVKQRPIPCHQPESLVCLQVKDLCNNWDRNVCSVWDSNRNWMTQNVMAQRQRQKGKVDRAGKARSKASNVINAQTDGERNWVEITKILVLNIKQESELNLLWIPLVTYMLMERL
jgi:hypothetical protein